MKKGNKNNEISSKEKSVEEIIDLDELQPPNETISQKYFDADPKWHKSLYKIQSLFNLLTPNKNESSLIDMLKIDEKIRFSF